MEDSKPDDRRFVLVLFSLNPKEWPRDSMYKVEPIARKVLSTYAETRVAIVGTKSDLILNDFGHDDLDHLRLKTLCPYGLGASYFGISSETGSGIHDLLNHISKLFSFFPGDGFIEARDSL